jgi:hypothetical protein
VVWVIVLSALSLLLSGSVAIALFWERQYVDYEDHEEMWVCEDCGMVVYSTTVEGIIEGMRIHEQAIECPKEMYFER